MVDRDTPEVRKAKRQALRQRRIVTYLAEHGTTPPCACGCREPVTFSERGMLNKYILGHHGDAARYAVKVRIQDNIPIEDFRRALRKLMATKNWTLADVCRLGGINMNTLNSTLYCKRRKTVGREWARNLLARLSGAPRYMDATERARQKQLDRAYASLDHAYGV